MTYHHDALFCTEASQSDISFTSIIQGDEDEGPLALSMSLQWPSAIWNNLSNVPANLLDFSVVHSKSEVVFASHFCIKACELVVSEAALFLTGDRAAWTSQARYSTRRKDFR